MGLLREFLESNRSEAELLEVCMERVRRLDGEVRAWAAVSPQTRIADGPLRGIPFGVKDIFDTKGLPTEFGSPIYAGRTSERDASLVRELKNLGAVVLGKTHTTAFAYFDPGPTRNPRDLRHTPGGSSSGSAAAVAAGMVPFALGSQTQGSVLRPASYCGVVGFKATYGALPLEGVLPFAPTLDTAGLFTQTAEDMRLLWKMMGFAVDEVADVRLGLPDPLPKADMGMERTVLNTAAHLRSMGFQVERVELPHEFGSLLAASRLINDYEGARTHHQRWKEHGQRIGIKLADLVTRGMRIPAEQYEAALASVACGKKKISELFRDVPVILSPAAPGPAPLGLESTGDPRMNAPWTALGTPAISVPMPVERLPLGLQLTADSGQDSMLVKAAACVESCLTPDR